MAAKVLFIDRDGTLIEEPDDCQVDAIEKVRLVSDVIPALLELAAHGYRFIIVSNQDGLGTASFPQPKFDVCHEHDKRRKQLIAWGFDQNDLSRLGLQALEEQAYELERFVEIHEIRY